MISPYPSPENRGCLRLSLGRFFFQWRDLLPVPLVLGMIRYARPTFLGGLLALPILVAGEMLRLWGLTHIGPTTRTRAICADRLVTTGPYALCRHPLYVANLLKVLAFLIMAGHARFALAALTFYGTEFLFMIPYEEEFLREHFPEAFAAYAATVPVFFPRFDRSAMTPVGEFSWGDAFWSERRTFASSGLIVCALACCWLLRRGNA